MTREEAIELIRSSALSELTDEIASHLLPSARIIVADKPASDGENSSVSYFGGPPSLPRNFSWPDWDRGEYLKGEIASLEKGIEAFAQRTQDQPGDAPGYSEWKLSGMRARLEKLREKFTPGRVPLAFLGQISLCEVQAVVPLLGWPTAGTLAFFYDALNQHWGFDPLDRGHCRVLFFTDGEPLFQATAPCCLHDDIKFPKYSVRFESEWTLPSRLSIEGMDTVMWETGHYEELLKSLCHTSQGDSEQKHRAGGHPQQHQQGMPLECQLVTNGIYCGGPSGYKNPRRAELEKGVPDWRLLAQFDSDEARFDWMWGDLGRVYFWARQQDIEATNFDGAWAILQCG